MTPLEARKTWLPKRGAPCATPASEHQRWDEAVRKMVAAYGSWQTAYDLTKRLQREEAQGGWGSYHWNKMLDAFERSRSVGMAR